MYECYLNTERLKFPTEKKQVDRLVLQLDDLDQYEKRNTAELHGILVLPNDDVNSIVKKVKSALDLRLVC